MPILYFDTETTGLAPGQICQLSYIIESSDRIKSKNFYFSVDYVEPAAAAITGLTVPRLAILSNGNVFGDYIDEIEADINCADVLVAHNFNFDWSFMRAEFERRGKLFRFKDKFCTMREFRPRLKLPTAKGYYKYPSLAEFACFYGVSNENTVSLAQKLFDSVYSAHDARYDTTMMFLALSKARNCCDELNCYFSTKL